MEMSVKSYQVPEISILYSTKGLLKDRPKVNCSKEVVEVLRPIYEDFVEHHEEVYAIYLNSRSRVLGVTCVSKGGIMGATCDPKIVFQAALKCNATQFIISHNHPSGNLIPSREDQNFTERLKKGGDILELTLLDHIIITAEGYYSFGDDGNL